jgi:cellulose synthase/poly-beta-1,6-N-acetylglucosamine synthase-like glycosyltransferase
MRLGLAIPCYADHLPQLGKLLEDVAAQTRLPDAVVVSCSSMPTEPVLPNYPFPIRVLTHPEYRNAAQNRNCAAEYLFRACDAVSFFDADDRMHPQRLEAVERALENSDLVLHGYLDGEAEAQPPPWDGAVELGILHRAPSGCAYAGPDRRIHHSQVTVRSGVFARVQFPEAREMVWREDALFCGWALELGMRNAYLNYPFSRYTPNRTWESALK